MKDVLSSEFEEKEFTLLRLYQSILFKTTPTLKYITDVKYDGFILLTICIQLALVLVEKVNWYYLFDGTIEVFHYMAVPTMATFLILLFSFSLLLLCGLRILRVQIHLKELLTLMVYSSVPFLFFNLLSLIANFFRPLLRISVDLFSTEIRALNFFILFWCFYILYHGIIFKHDMKEAVIVLLVISAILSYTLIYFLLQQEEFVRFFF